MIKDKIKSILKQYLNLDIGLAKQKKFYKNLIKPNDLCFDIGANLGRKSTFFLSLNTKVIAFEPQTKCHNYLSQIKNKNFKFYPYGVGAKNETKLLHLANHIEVATFSNKMIGFYTTENLKWDKTEKVIVKNLDTLIKEFGLPYFCKIDTEGFEFEILSNLTFTIPIIEFEFAEAFIAKTIKLISILEKKHTLYNYNLNEKPKFELNNWVNAEEMIKIFKTIKKNKLHGNIFVKNI